MRYNSDVSDFLNLINRLGGEDRLGNRFPKPRLSFEFNLLADRGKFVKVFYKF